MNVIKDKNIDKIKSVVKSYGDYEVYLFGSRARGNNRPGSDYDIIVVSKDDMDEKNKFMLYSQIDGELSKNLIPADILIESENEIKRKKEYICNVIRYASREWIKL